MDDSYCDRIHPSITTVHGFHNGYVGKQPVAWEEYCEECWLKDLQARVDRCTGHCNITEILMKTAFNQLINSLTAYDYFSDGHVGNQPVAWKGYHGDYL